MSSKNLKTRNHILKTTWKLLESGAGNRVRMTDIATASSLSRQAIYLHFPTRSELLIATTRFIDDTHNVDDRLYKSRHSSSGVERLNNFIDAWGNYIPEIYGMAKAFWAMMETDAAAAAAWNGRMQAVRHGCDAAVKALKADGVLSPDYSMKQAADILWALLSVENWEKFRYDCKWSQQKYIKTVQSIAFKTLVIEA